MLDWFSWQCRGLCVLCVLVYRQFSANAGEKRHCYLRASSTSDWITMETLRNIARPRALKLQFAGNFAMAVLRSRERDTLKLSGYIGDDKFRNLRIWTQQRIVCSRILLKFSWIIGLINFILQPSQYVTFY